MVLKKKGQVQLYVFMLAMVIIILALAIAPAVKQSVDIARNQTNGDTIGMDCSNSSISNFQKAGCIAADITIFHFIGGLIMIAGSVLAAKIIFS